jgi:hypothetical protein
MISEAGGQMQFWAHYQLAQLVYCKQKILSPGQYNFVDWKSVHSTLHDLPWLFQVCAAKHVLEIVGTMEFLAHQDDKSPLCPSCNKYRETCKHIARCPEAGHALAFEQSAQGMEH